jgi:exodeoxyribonuclease VII small subunit
LHIAQSSLSSPFSNYTHYGARDLLRLLSDFTGKAHGSSVRLVFESYSSETETAMPSFEDSLKKLETIVDQLEKGDLALEDSLKLFEEGVGLSASCKTELDAAEGKVQMLVKQRDGSLKPEPFLTEKPL